jgi:hypothetical protein
MSYRGYGCSAWLTSWEFIKSIAPEEAKAFEEACAKEFPDEENPMDAVAGRLIVEDDIDTDTACLLTELNNKFWEVTRGLGLSLGWIEYDEVDSDIHGAVWYVGGVEELTPAGKKYEKNLFYEQWVEYG